MKIFNDSNADCKEGKTSVFLKDVETDEDIMINSSCVFLGSLITKGTIQAHYHLTVFGNIEAGNSLVVGETLSGYKKVKAETISVQGKLNVTGAINCKELSVGRDAVCDSLFCQNADIGESLISKGPVDIQSDIKVKGSIICNDEVYIGGNLSCKSVIADLLDAANAPDALFINIASGETTGSSTGGDTSAESSMDLLKVIDSPLTDIYNSDSQLAISMEALATIIEHLNEKIEADIGPDEMKLINAFGGFLPEYDRLAYVFQDSLIALHDQDYSTAKWFPDFNSCAKAYLSLPKWAKQIKLANMLREKLQKLINVYLTRDFVTTSKTEWIRAMGYLQRLIDQEDAMIIDNKIEIRNKMFGNLGLKPFGIMVKLPKE